MLRMEQVHVIRHKVVIEGQSQRRVAREMGLSRNTVKKYLEVSEPKRLELNPRSRPVLEEVTPRMDQLLEEWAGRVTAKQRLTGSRLHRELVQEGYQVGVTPAPARPSRERLWALRWALGQRSSLRVGPTTAPR